MVGVQFFDFRAVWIGIGLGIGELLVDGGKFGLRLVQFCLEFVLFRLQRFTVLLGCVLHLRLRGLRHGLAWAARLYPRLVIFQITIE